MTRLLFFTGALLCGLLTAGSAHAADSRPVPGSEAVMVLDDFLDDGEEGTDGRRKPIQERIDNLPPGQREKAMQRADEMKSRRARLEAELKSLPPEEREARMRELREDFSERREEHREEFRRKFRQRWESATPEEREAFCGNARGRCAEGGGLACTLARESCGG